MADPSFFVWNATVMYCVMFLKGIFYPLGQGPYFDQYIFEVGGNNLMVGGLESIAGVTKVLIAFPIGYMLDSRPSRRSTFAPLGLLIGCIMAVPSVFAILGGQIKMLTLMEVLFTICIEFVMCFAMAIFADTMSRRDEDSTVWVKIEVFQNLGSALAYGFYAVVLLFCEVPSDWTGLQTKAVLLAAVVLLFTLMLSLVAFRDPPALPISVSKDEKMRPNGRSEASELRGGAAVPYVVLLGMFIFALATGMIFKFFPLFFIDVCGLSRLQITLVGAVDPIMKALIAYVIGICANIAGRELVTCMCLVGLVTCLLAMSVLSNLWELLAFFMLRGGLSAGSFSLLWSILMDHAPASQKGRWSSSLTVLNVSWSGAALVGGKLIDTYGHPFTFRVVAGLFAAVLAIFVLLFRLKLRSPEGTEGTQVKAPQDASQVNQVVVVVDPFSTGGALAAELLDQGYFVISLWTKESETRYHDYPPALDAQQLLAELDEAATLDATAAAVRQAVGSHVLAAVICGGDSGVKMTDALSEVMKLRGNGTLSQGHRRDKLLQQEAVRAAGLRFARTVSGTTWEEVAAFAETEDYPLVVKPIESAGGDGFKLCYSFEEAREHFDFLRKSSHWCGAQGSGLLLQEFLVGTEYVVDHVSCDGVHKTTMLWMYDFQTVNGSRVCVAQKPISSDSFIAKELIDYTRKCLDALCVRNGASHTEVIWTSSGPCLVEVNCRCQGGNGFWVPLCRKMTGYSQVDACIDAFLREEAFRALPDTPTFLMTGLIMHLLSYDENHVITAMPGIEAVRNLASFVNLAMNIEVGKLSRRTTDWYTMVGVVALCHPNQAVLVANMKVVQSTDMSTFADV